MEIIQLREIKITNRGDLIRHEYVPSSLGGFASAQHAPHIDVADEGKPIPELLFQVDHIQAIFNFQKLVCINTARYQLVKDGAGVSAALVDELDYPVLLVSTPPHILKKGFEKYLMLTLIPSRFQKLFVSSHPCTLRSCALKAL